MKKVLSCVVSFRNPEHLRQAIAAQSKMQVPKGYQLEICIVDNSVDPDLIPEIQAIQRDHNCRLIVMEQNQGVSGAYAKCIDVVVQEGFDFMWLWDQDSLPPSDCLSVLLQSFEKEPAKQQAFQEFAQGKAQLAPLGMVGPKLMDPNFEDEFYVFFNFPYSLNLMNKRRFPMERLESGEVETTYLVNSGTLVSRQVIISVGGPDTDFFMDLVDFEYCSKVVSAGFRLVVNADTIVKHRVGAPLPFEFFGRKLFGRDYPPFRYYYQARNDILLSRMGYLPWTQALAMVIRVFVRGLRIALTEKQIFSKLRANYQGWWDGLLGRRGQTHSSWMMKR